MGEQKNILVPIDGSAFSLQILESLHGLFPPPAVRLILLQVEPEMQGRVAGPYAPSPLGGSYEHAYANHHDANLAHHPIYATQEWESQSAAVRAAMQGVMNRMQALGYQTQLLVRFGEPAEEIINYAESAPVDLIAMTTHGRTGLQRLLFGSVAAAVMKRVSVPVLMVRPFATHA